MMIENRIPMTLSTAVHTTVHHVRPRDVDDDVPQGGRLALRLPDRPSPGAADPVHARIGYGPAAETTASGLLTSADGVPVRVSGQVAAGPESYEWTLYGSRASYRITEWGRLWKRDESGWREVTPAGPRGDERTRPTEFARALRGEPTLLADFSAGLRVQRVVEGLKGADG
ncbi:hypothetical protein AB0N14_26375 [Streptomyces sp. NPDC051104]|uniref:hypothetical protein n=1 Tax=Streptomyces sp. NPDC051104 TaxID=3155044 RepID=UPI003441A653